MSLYLKRVQKKFPNVFKTKGRIMGHIKIEVEEGGQNHPTEKETCSLTTSTSS